MDGRGRWCDRRASLPSITTDLRRAAASVGFGVGHALRLIGCATGPGLPMGGALSTGGVWTWRRPRRGPRQGLGGRGVGSAARGRPGCSRCAAAAGEHLPSAVGCACSDHRGADRFLKVGTIALGTDDRTCGSSVWSAPGGSRRGRPHRWSAIARGAVAPTKAKRTPLGRGVRSSSSGWTTAGPGPLRPRRAQVPGPRRPRRAQAQVPRRPRRAQVPGPRRRRRQR